jgi:hypothetical protein
MKRLNRDIAALFNTSSYRFVWQESVDPVEATRREYNSELANNLNANLTGLLNSVNLLDGSEEDFEEADEAYEILKNNPKKLGKSDAKWSERWKYRRNARKARRVVKKEKKRRDKALDKDENRLEKNFNRLPRRSEFIDSFKDLEKQLEVTRKQESKLQECISSKHNFSSKRKDILKGNLQSAKTNTMLAGVGYLDNMISVLAEDVDGEGMQDIEKLKVLQSQRGMLEDVYQQYFKYYTLFTTKGLSAKEMKGYVKSFQSEIEQKAEQARNEKISTAARSASESELRSDLSANFLEVKGFKDEMDGFDADIKAQQTIIDAAKAKPYQTDATRQEISNAQGLIDSYQANKLQKKSELKSKANNMLEAQIKTYETNGESVVVQSRQLMDGLDNAIDAVKEKINSAPTNAVLKKELEQLQQAQAALAKGVKVGPTDQITNGALKTALENNYNGTAIVNRDKSKLDLETLKLIFKKDRIPYDNLTSTAPMDYESILRRQDQAESARERRQEQDRLRSEINSQKKSEKDAAAAERIYYENDIKPSIEGFRVSAGYQTYAGSKSDLVATNRQINESTARVNDLKRRVAKLRKDGLDPSAASLDLTTEQTKLSGLLSEKDKNTQGLKDGLKAMRAEKTSILDNAQLAVDAAKESRRTSTTSSEINFAQQHLDESNRYYNTIKRYLEQEIASVKDFSYLLPSNEGDFNQYMDGVLSDDLSVYSYRESRSRNSSRLDSSRSRSSNLSSRSRYSRIKDLDTNKIPDYDLDYDTEELFDGANSRERSKNVKARIESVVKEKSMQNEVVRLINLGPVMAVQESRLTKFSATRNDRVPFGNDLIVMIQPKDPRTGELKSNLYYKVGSDGQLSWVAGKKLANGNFASLRPKTGEKYGFKKSYNTPGDLAKYLSEGRKPNLWNDMKNRRKIERHQDHVKKLVEQIEDIDGEVVTDYDMTYPNMHIDASVYNPETEDDFSVKFTLNEKGQWVIEKEFFDELDESDQRVLKGFGIRSGKTMSRSYFQKRLSQIARQDANEDIGPVRQFFRNAVKRVRRGWNWVKGVFGY